MDLSPTISEMTAISV